MLGQQDFITGLWAITERTKLDPKLSVPSKSLPKFREREMTNLRRIRLEAAVRGGEVLA